MPKTAPAFGSPEFGPWLQEQREKWPGGKLSQEKLARSVGVGRKQPQRWEKGEGIEYPNYLKVIALFDAVEPVVEATPALYEQLADVAHRLERIERIVSATHRRVPTRDGADAVDRMVDSIIASNERRWGEGSADVS